MKFSATQYARALFELHEKKNIAALFAAALKRHGTLSLFSKIMRSYEKLLEKKDGGKNIFLECADEKSAALFKKSFWEKAAVEEKLQSTLIAGVRATLGDTRIDTSLARRLQTLKETFAQA